MEPNRPVTGEVRSSVMKTHRSSSPGSSSSDNAAAVDSRYYNINDGRRIAVIFNQENFIKIKKKRVGTERDGNRMKACLEKLNFETEMHKDLEKTEIKKIIKRVSKMKSSDVSCVVVVVMTHGGANGVLGCAKDSYSKSCLTDPFLESDTLRGVPKLFFIQACRGEEDNKGLEVDGESVGVLPYEFPTQADFLMMCSTVDDHKSWRALNGSGSYFIQSLCEELELAAQPDYELDLLQMLTIVNREVAETIINDNTSKQISEIETTMTKLLKFSA